MPEIFVNLKRFDVPRELGGVCEARDPKTWIEGVIGQIIDMGLAKREEIHLTLLLPEALLIHAIGTLRSFSLSERNRLDIGSQSVYREDVAPGGNFGAFTSFLPAAAASNMGCTWTMVGHSEERRDKFEVMASYDPEIWNLAERTTKANSAINTLLNKAVLNALDSGMNVLYCVGETAQERGGGLFEEQKARIGEVLRRQLIEGLKNSEKYCSSRKIVVAYEPRWAIGPGKTPPTSGYIEYISSFIKDEAKKTFGFPFPVVYGGGLKQENAAEIAAVKSIDGGLVALTRFTGEIGFEPEGLRSIIEKYLGAL